MKVVLLITMEDMGVGWGGERAIDSHLNTRDHFPDIEED